LANTNGCICGVIIKQVKIGLNVFIVEKKSNNKLEQVQVTMQEIWQQTKPKVHRNKKKYSRKNINNNTKL